MKIPLTPEQNKELQTILTYLKSNNPDLGLLGLSMLKKYKFLNKLAYIVTEVYSTNNTKSFYRHILRFPWKMIWKYKLYRHRCLLEVLFGLIHNKNIFYLG